MSISSEPTESQLPTNRASHVRYFVLAWLSVAATVAYIGRNCLGVAVGDIRGELGISVGEMGLVLSAFFWSYALAQIPCGWLGHVWGTRRALTVFALTWSVACAAMGFATGAWSLVVFQLLFGVAQAGIFPCSAAAITQWLPTSRRAIASGSLGSFMSIGGAIGVALTGFALSWISWRWVFVIFALPGFIWAIGFYIWFRNRPEEHSAVSQDELKLIRADDPNQKPAKTDPHPLQHGLNVMLAVILSFDMWMICGQQFFRGAGYIFFATWFPTYLVETRGVSTAESGYLTALPLMAVVAGCLLGGLLVDRIWNRTGSRRLSRQAVALVAMLGCAVFIGIAYFVHHPLAAVLLISTGTFFASLGGPCAYTVTMDKAGQHVAPIFGTMNMCGNFGAAVCPLVVAWMAEWLGQWDLVLLLFVGIYVAAAVCWSLLDPNGTFLERWNDRNAARIHDPEDPE